MHQKPSRVVITFTLGLPSRFDNQRARKATCDICFKFFSNCFVIFLSVSLLLHRRVVMKNSCQVGDSASVYTLLAALCDNKRPSKISYRRAGRSISWWLSQTALSTLGWLGHWQTDSLDCWLPNLSGDMTCKSVFVWSLFTIALTLNGYDCLGLAMEMWIMFTS